MICGFRPGAFGGALFSSYSRYGPAAFGMSRVYVVRLEENKWYVGRSDNVQGRFRQHVQGTGSAWTQLHRPLSIEETRPVEGVFNEDNVVKEYMMKFGIDNVRGGSYSAVELDERSLAVLEREIRNAIDACFKCGELGHYSSDCPNRFKRIPNISGNASPASVRTDEPTTTAINQHRPIRIQLSNAEPAQAMKPFSSSTCDSAPAAAEIEDRCLRCGRTGHVSNMCYARTTFDGRHF